MKPSSLAGALLVLTALGCGGRVDLCDHRVTGGVRTYLRTTDIEAVNPSGNRGRVRSEVTTRETAVEVLRDGDATLDVSIDRVLFEFFGEGPEATVRVDSAAPPSAQESAAAPATPEEKLARRVSPFRHAVGGVVGVEERKTRLVTGVSRTEDLRRRVVENLAEGDDRRGIYDQFSWQHWVVNLLKPAIVVQAEGMAPGKDSRFLDMRTLPETTGTGGYMYYAGTCRLAKVEGGIARVEMDAEVFLDPVGPSLAPWPKDLAARRNFLRLKKGTCKAFARIEVETGLLLEDEHATDLDLYFVKPDGKGEMAIPQRVTLRSKLVR